MNKKVLLAFLTVLIVILGSNSVLGYDDLDISDVDYDSPINPGNTIVGTFNLQNKGTTQTTASFSGYTLTDSAGRTLQINQISDKTLNANGSQIVTFYVNVPSDKYASTYTGTLMVIGTTSSDSFSISITVNSNQYTLTNIGGISTAVLGDTTASGTAVVKNNRNVDITVTKSGTLTFGSNSLVITSGTQKLDSSSNNDVTYLINVPKSTAAGLYSGQLTLSYDSGTKSLSIPVQLNVPEQRSVSVPSSISMDMRPGEKTSKQITITNDGNVDLQNINLNSADITDGNGDKINITVSPLVINISKSSSRTITITADADSDINKENYSSPISVFGDGVSKTVDFSVNVKDILEITSVDVSSDDDDEIFKPGETMLFKVKIKNFAKEIDLNDVSVRIEIWDDNGDIFEDEDGDEYEEEEDLGSLDSGDTETVEVEFKMPYNIDDGDRFTVYVEVTGEEDDSGQEHTVTDESLEIKAEKSDHEIEVYRASLDSNTLACARTTYLNIGLRNIGSRNEDVEVNIVNLGLGIDIVDLVEDMSDDPDDDEFEVSKSYFIDAAGIDPGSYPIAIRVFYDDGDEKVTPTAPILKIERCTLAGYDEEEDDYTPPGSGSNSGSSYTGNGAEDDEIEFTYSDSDTSSSTQPSTATPPIRITDTSGGFGGDSYMIVLAISAFVIIAIIIGIVFMMMKK